MQQSFLRASSNVTRDPQKSLSLVARPAKAQQRTFIFSDVYLYLPSNCIHISYHCIKIFHEGTWFHAPSFPPWFHRALALPIWPHYLHLLSKQNSSLLPLLSLCSWLYNISFSLSNASASMSDINKHPPLLQSFLAILIIRKKMKNELSRFYICSWSRQRNQWLKILAAWRLM